MCHMCQLSQFFRILSAANQSIFIFGGTIAKFSLNHSCKLKDFFIKSIAIYVFSRSLHYL